MNHRTDRQQAERAFAQKMVRIGAEVRGEKFNAKHWVEAPPQNRTVLTAEMITAYFAKRKSA